jgi:hypothetical protein
LNNQKKRLLRYVTFRKLYHTFNAANPKEMRYGENNNTSEFHKQLSIGTLHFMRNEFSENKE